MRTGILGEHASIGGGSQSLLIELPISLGMSNLNLPHTSQAAPTKVVWNKFNRTLSRRTMLPACPVEGRVICVGDSGPVLSIRHPLVALNPPTRPLSIVFPLALLIIIQSISREE